MHIAQGILKSINVNKLTSAGCVFKFWVADWFALLNNKMGGDLKKIRTVGLYMIEVWRAAGMDMDNVEFLWASDEINARSNEYWLRVMDIARRFNVPRVLRCCTIMGRSETDDLSAAQIYYPCMQCADIFFLKVRARLVWLATFHRLRPTDRQCFTGIARASHACSRRPRAPSWAHRGPHDAPRSIMSNNERRGRSWHGAHAPFGLTCGPVSCSRATGAIFLILSGCPSGRCRVGKTIAADNPTHTQADICQLGMDQRKVNMLAREYCDVAEPKIKHKPIILSHRE
jgi:hypothetical protein